MHDGVALLTAGLHIVFTNLVTFIGPILSRPIRGDSWWQPWGALCSGHRRPARPTQATMFSCLFMVDFLSPTSPEKLHPL
jgi:hypothetical protein